MNARPFSGRRCRIVVGLPGSGKTHYAQGLGPDWAVADDPETPDALNSHTNDLLCGKDLVITSPHFCNAESLALAQAEAARRWPGIAIETVFFENDPQACAKNAARRAGKPVVAFIAFLSKGYAPPEAALPVWRPNAEFDPSLNL